MTDHDTNDTYIGDHLETVEPELTTIEQRRRQLNDSLRFGTAVLSLPPRQWIVRDWIPLDALVAVYAAPGVGKSFYAVTLALELARGVRWIENLKRDHRVLYVAVEKPADIRDRVDAWSRGTGHAIPDGFVMLPARTQISPGSLDVQLLCEMIAKHRIDVVVLDTYAAATAGVEENSSKDTGEVMGQLAAIKEATRGGSVIIVHHSGKDNSRGLRGSTAFLGAVELTIELATDEDGNISATVAKSNAGRDGIKEHYKLDPVQLPPVPGDIESRTVPHLIHTGTPVLRGSTEEMIIDVLHAAGAPITRKMIATEMSHRGEGLSTQQLNRYLRRMTGARQISKQGSENRPTYSPVSGGSILPFGDDE